MVSEGSGPRRSERIRRNEIGDAPIEKVVKGSPPDFAAGKTRRGRLKRPLDTEDSQQDDINQRPEKKVKFSNIAYMRDIDPNLSKEVKIEYKSNISIMKEHGAIFREKYRKIEKLYLKLRKILGKEELISRTGFRAKDIDKLKKTYLSFDSFEEKGMTSDEDCNKLLEITEEAMSKLEKLEGIEEEVKKSKQEEPHSDTEKQI